jgi:hypothetical protein
MPKKIKELAAHVGMPTPGVEFTARENTDYERAKWK